MILVVKNLLASPGDGRYMGWILGWEDPLEKGMATRSRAWEIPWTEEPGGLHSMGLQSVEHDWARTSWLG